jgi:signal transduction histidine kinase
MSRFLRKLPLHIKLTLISLIPFCFLVYLTIEVYNGKTEKLELFHNYKAYMEESANINGLIDALQEERKYTFDYTITKSHRRELLLQRPKTDSYIEKLIKSNNPALKGFTEFTKLSEMSKIRNRVDSLTCRPDEVMHFYSNTAFRINTLNTLPPPNTPYLGTIYGELMAQQTLSEISTYLGIIRSNIYNVLHTRQYMVETLMGTYGTYDVYKSYEKELLLKSTPEILEKYKSIRNTTALKPTAEYIDTLFKNFSFDESLDAASWWKMSNEGNDEVRKLQAALWKSLNGKLDRLYKHEQQSQLYSLLLLIVALVLACGMVAYICYLISKSLQELRLASEKISNGIIGISLTPETDDAMGQLAQSIIRIDQSNLLLTNAAAAIGKGEFDIDFKPRSSEDKLGHAITQMKNELRQYSLKMEQLVNTRTEELTRSNDDLRQFAYVASHDLKEPLRKIRMFSNILSEEHQGQLSEKGKIYLQKIESAAERMAAMVEGVLLYSTVNVDGPSAEMVNLNKIIEGVISDLELVIIRKEAQIEFKDLPDVFGNPLLLTQLFFNLINNALKFSKPDVNPVIAISAETVKASEIKNISNHLKEGDYIHIIIKDNGIGFNPAYAERMFDVFSRLHAKDIYEGTGLGLALCRKIVYRHGGIIYAEGEDRKGAAFHIFLPA